ncbi:alkaline phosphatase family protein [candidate division KSB1 bacterium]
MNRRDALRLLAYSGAGIANLGAASSLLSGCAHIGHPKEVKAPDKYGITILADGFRADMFKEMLDAGELPNIKKHLVDRGTMVENCIGTLPSTSGPAHLALINGRMPGTNNCPGLRWIDRKNNVVRDYCTLETLFFNRDFPPENYTLYEMLAGNRTVCIFDFVSRGAAESYRPSVKTLWGTMSDDKDKWSELDVKAVEKFVTVCEKEPFPMYSFVWMPAIDHLSHLYSSTDDLIIKQAVVVDKQVGRIMDLLRQKGIYDKTLVSLAADHGLRDTDNNMDIREPLERSGFDVLRELSGNDDFNTLSTNNAVRGVSGNGCALLYFARKKKVRWAEWIGWEDKPAFEELKDFPVKGGENVDLFDLLRNETAVKFVMTTEKEDFDYRTYRVFTKEGDARIERNELSKELKYTVISGPDPLGYSGSAVSRALMNGDFHDKDLWYKKTLGTDYPDALFQISQIFDSERCGDIVVSSTPGWDFMNQEHQATHGGLEKDEMMVPCVFAGPGIKEGETILQARTVDLYPIYLEFFGVPNLDGEVPNVFKK